MIRKAKHPFRAWNRMNLSVFLLLIPFLLIAQENKVTIEGQNISLTDVFQLIESQTTFSVAYEQSTLDLQRNITLSLHHTEIDRAMNVILSSTPYTYRIKDYHIIIYPQNKQQTDLNTATVSPSSTYFIQGILLDKTTQTPINYASITLLDSLCLPLDVTTSINGGYFGYRSHKRPYYLRIRHIGYEEKLVTLNFTTEMLDVGNIQLITQNNLLDEVLVSSLLNKNSLNKTSHLVTKKMRDKSLTAKEILGQIHGIHYDKQTDKLSLNGQTSQLMLFDGIQYSESYLDALSPNQIHAVEIITEPSGRHLIEGKNSIINLILKKDYNGYDLYLNNKGTAGLTRGDGNNWLTRENPGVGFTYSKNKFNLFANYSYSRSQFNTLTFRAVSNRGDLEAESEVNSKANPNNQYEFQSNSMALGLNYKFSPNHILSFQLDYNFEKDNKEECFIFNVYDRTKNTHSRFSNSVGRKISADDYVGTLYYNGTINERLKLYSDITYNYFKNTTETHYEYLNSTYQTGARTPEYKYHTKANLNVNYQFPSNLHLDIGYVNSWRTYELGVKSTTLKYKEQRNKLFSFLSFTPHKKLSIKGGFAVEHFTIHRDEIGTNRFALFQPSFYVNYLPSKQLKLNLSYTTVTQYPNIYQLSPVQVGLDSLVHISGNVNLLPSTERTLLGTITLFNRFTLTSTYQHLSDYIGEELYPPSIFGTPDEPHFYYSHGFTYNNMDMKRYSVQAIYDQPLGNYFNISSSAQYYKNSIKKGRVSKAVDGWLWNSELCYFNPKMKLGFQLGYFRNLAKDVTLQGGYSFNSDYWLISFNKQFWDRKASIRLSYVPPLSWGIRKKQSKQVKTPDYKEHYTFDLTPHQNTLHVHFVLRFNSGKNMKANKQSTTEKERRIRTVGN